LHKPYKTLLDKNQLYHRDSNKKSTMNAGRRLSHSLKQIAVSYKQRSETNG